MKTPPDGDLATMDLPIDRDPDEDAGKDGKDRKDGKEDEDTEVGVAHRPEARPNREEEEADLAEADLVDELDVEEDLK